MFNIDVFLPMSYLWTVMNTSFEGERVCSISFKLEPQYAKVLINVIESAKILRTFLGQNNWCRMQLSVQPPIAGSAAARGDIFKQDILSIAKTDEETPLPRPGGCASRGNRSPSVCLQYQSKAVYTSRPGPCRLKSEVSIMNTSFERGEGVERSGRPINFSPLPYLTKWIDTYFLANVIVIWTYLLH